MIGCRLAPSGTPSSEMRNSPAVLVAAVPGGHPEHGLAEASSRPPSGSQGLVRQRSPGPPRTLSCMAFVVVM